MTSGVEMVGISLSNRDMKEEEKAESPRRTEFLITGSEAVISGAIASLASSLSKPRGVDVEGRSGRRGVRASKSRQIASISDSTSVTPPPPLSLRRLRFDLESEDEDDDISQKESESILSG